jgi:hypothetical protein
MASGLFDSPSAADSATLPPEDHAYRALSGTAIAAGVLALLGPLALIDWWLLTVPALGCLLGILAWRDVVQRPDVLTGRRLAMLSAAWSAVVFAGALGYLSWVYAAELPPGFERISYGPLQPEDGMAPGTIPASALALHGQDVLLKGYMYPGKQQSGIRQFLLVRDQGDCCFGGNPKITDRVLVQLRDGDGITFSPRQRKIAGRFLVKPTGGIGDVDGGVLYHLEDAFVR